MDTSTVPLKQCSRKGKCVHPEKTGDGWLPAMLKYFRVDKKNGQLKARCIECDREAARLNARRRYADPEKHERILERRRAYNAKSEKKAQRKVYNDKYHLEHREENKEYCRARHSNPDFIQWQKEYYARPDVIERDRAKVQKYRLSPDRQQRESEHAKEYNRRPEVRKRNQERRRTPEEREKARQRHRIRKMTPEFKQWQRDYLKRPDVQERTHERRQKYMLQDAYRERRRLRTHERRARIRGLPSESINFQLALAYFDYRCAACGRSVDFWHTLAADHWIAVTDPRPDNPGTVQGNILPLCHSKKGAPSGESSCNQSKWNKDPEQWLIERFGKRKAHAILKRINTYFDWVREQDEGKGT